MNTELFSGTRIDGVFLWETQLDRGDGDPSTPGRVETVGDYEISAEGFPESWGVIYKVECTMRDEGGQEIATLRTSYLITYGTDGATSEDVSDEHLREYAMRAGVFQIHPYFRQHIASTTTGAGLPSLLLPPLVVDFDEE